MTRRVLIPWGLLAPAGRFPSVTWQGKRGMRLPNEERAVVDPQKLRDDCLNLQHPCGRHKARVFASAGIPERDAEALQEALLSAARISEAEPGPSIPYGRRFVLDFEHRWRDRTVRICSAWTVRNGEDLPRLTTCHAL